MYVPGRSGFSRASRYELFSSESYLRPLCTDAVELGLIVAIDPVELPACAVIPG